MKKNFTIEVTWDGVGSVMHGAMMSMILLIIMTVCMGCPIASGAAFDQTALNSPNASSVQNAAPADIFSSKPLESSLDQAVSQNAIQFAGHEKTVPPDSSSKDASPLSLAQPHSKGETTTKTSDPAKMPLSGAVSPQTLKNETVNNDAAPNPSKIEPGEARNQNAEETEGEIMEEALLLLDESHKYWVKGEMEDALNMLDQAYALLIDTNGNSDIARQKDDLRLMISKRILAIYSSLQSTTAGTRGEIPIITNEDVEKEIRNFQTVERDFFISSYQRSTIYRPVILRELRKAGLPEELSWLPLVESGFKINALSPARALGLWQFIPSTGYKYGLNRDDWVDERMDVEKSTRAAIDYLKDLHEMFGDWLTVLAAYNCGEGRVMRTIAAQHINYLDRFWDLYQKLPYETARYVPRFLATLLVVRNPQQYGMDLGSGDLKTEIVSYETVQTDRCMRLCDIAQKLEASEETLSVLNAELRHRMTPDRPYPLKLPIEKVETLLSVIAEIPGVEKPRGSLRASNGRYVKHKIRRGETLSSIAKKYNTSVSAIRSANHLSKNRLVAGHRLNIPVRMAKGPAADKKKIRTENVTVYQVQKGDTLSTLSRTYRISVEEMRRINQLQDDTLQIGQVLRFTGIGRDGKTNLQETSNGSASDSKSSKQYTVKKGDSLDRIARANNIPLENLLTLNHMAKTDHIYPGQVILLQ